MSFSPPFSSRPTSNCEDPLHMTQLCKPTRCIDPTPSGDSMRPSGDPPNQASLYVGIQVS